MKTIAVSSLLLLGAATAQQIQSKPFNLVIQSANKSLNGEQLSACHSGAAIESLCLAGAGSEFYLNTTQGQQAPIEGLSPSGTLIWKLPYINQNNGTSPFPNHPRAASNNHRNRL